MFIGCANEGGHLEVLKTLWYQRKGLGSKGYSGFVKDSRAIVKGSARI